MGRHISSEIACYGINILSIPITIGNVGYDNKAEPHTRVMDLTILDYIRISIGANILLYVANCMVYQRVWIRKTFSWGAKEEYPKIFQMNIIYGTLIGFFLATGPFLF